MNQLSLIELDDPIKEAAIKLIKVYVLRGDSEESLRSGMLGAYCTYRASISGYIGNKQYNGHHIVVTKDINGNDCEAVYKLKDIIKEIKEKC